MIDLNRCFGVFWTREEDVLSTDMMKRLTFQYPECGDCSKSFFFLHLSFTFPSIMAKTNIISFSDHGPCDRVWHPWPQRLLSS